MRVTMIEVSASHSRRAGPPPFRKRTSRTATSQQRSTALSFYLNLQAQSQPQPYTKSHSESPLSTSNPVSYFDGQVDAQQQSPIQSTDLSHYTNLFNPTELSTSPTAVRPSFYQDGQFNHQWQSMLLATGQSMGLDQVASQFVDVSSPSTQNPIPLQMSSPELSMSWEDVPVPERNHRNSDVDNASLLEAQLGITSFGSCEYVTSPNHLGSSFSDYMIPSAETSLYGSPRSKNNLIQDLQIPAEYYHATGNNPTSMPSPASAGSPAYRDMFGFESESLAAVAGVASWMEDGANNSWATSNLPTSNTQPTLDHNFLFSWDTQGLVNETTERATFNGEQAAEYYAFAAPDQGPRVHPPMSIPTQDHIVATIWDGNGNGKNEDRRKSSQELISPRSRSGTPWQHSAEHHSHIFSVRSGIEKPKPTRGRMRPLTVKGKREALEVRNAGACWACHLSKVKCSPCSSGSPCEQCSRLHGKRRFCHLPCFNDPIDALNIFLIPGKMKLFW
ncbi:hypothetical protein PVAG01_10748 [Phlyctema vagabunda]|uniref:Zn(2)-C6 fungal-type domain-containing protein n=1 Tax=Phlyctema vagabunda TaxID=108571 RepID=A0ABR4P350_9HELO